MATKTNEETDGNQISSISSIFSDMKTMMDNFRQGLPDYIEKIISNKLDEQDAISLHANSTNIDEDSGSHNTDPDQGSAVGGTPQKDTDSLIRELFRNRKRKSSKDDDKPPLKMSREILHQVGDDLGIQEAEGPVSRKIFTPLNNNSMS